MRREKISRNFHQISVAAAIFIVCGLLSVANIYAAGITAVGPASVPLGFPQWIEDSAGLKLEMCNDATAFCIPFADGEGFWWMATAEAPPLVAAGRSLLVLAWEAAYGGTGAAVNGNQIIFARLRIRVDVATAGDYTITHPYGQITFFNVTVADGINYTEDIGGMHPVLVEQAYGGILAAKTAPALVWDDYLINPALVDPATGNRYVGDNLTPHTVTGSPTGNNLFRIEGPAPITSETNLFTVMGKLYTGVAPTPWTFPPPPPKNLAAVGPVNRVSPFKSDSIAEVTGGPTAGYPVGFPVWYQDKTREGLKMTICPGEDPMCISVPPDPADPESVALGVGDEAFFCTADARVTANGIDGLLVMALEAAFGGDGSPHDGDQMVFARIRIRIDTPVAGTYTVTHPFGTIRFTNVPAGTKAINYTEDIGGADSIDPDLAMNGALYGKISRFLTWTGYATDPHLTAVNAATGNIYIGDPLVEHTITGSPTGNNFFRIAGGGRTVQTSLFFVSGKMVIVPVATNDATITDQDTDVSIDVLSNDTEITGPVAVTIPSNSVPDNGTAVVNPDNTITYTPDPGFFGTDSFGYHISPADSPHLVSNAATVAIQVNSVGPFAISGTVTDTAGAPLAGVTINLTGPAIKTTVTDAADNYILPGRADGDYVVTPSLAGIVLTPPYRKVNIAGADVAAQDFAQTLDIVTVRSVIVSAIGKAATLNGPLWSLIGKGTPGTTLSIFLGSDFEGELIGTATVNRAGNWSFRKRALATLPLTEATSISISSSGGGAALNQPLTTVQIAHVSTRGTIATTSGPLWNLQGMGFPGTTVSIFLGADLTGELIDTVTVTQNGHWRLVGRRPVTLPITDTSISLSTSAGGTVLNKPLTVR